MRKRSLTLECLQQRHLLDAKLIVDIDTLESKFRPPPFPDEYPPTEIREVAPFQDSLLFYVHHQYDGDCWAQAGELWQTTGEVVERPFQIDTAPVAGFADVNNTAKLGITVGDRHFFSIENDCYYQSQLWSTYGSFGERMQTRSVAEFFLGDESDDSLQPENLTEFDGSLFLTVGGFSHGNELWRVDGTSSRVSLVKDINPDFAGYGNGRGSNPEQLTSTNEMLFFTANDGIRGRELWATDGTEANTRMVRDITPAGVESDGIGELQEHDGRLFFSADDGVNGSELWQSDGTVEGTLRIKDISVGAAGSTPTQLTSAGSELFFTSDDGLHGRELWASDGTPDGTRMVRDLRQGSASSTISQLTSVEDVLYFVNQDPFVKTDDADGSRSELWISDGTEDGTNRLFAPRGATDAVVNHLTPSDGKLFFVADVGFGPRLWKSDGTENGTFVVPGIPTNVTSIENMASVDETLYFTTESRQLWQVDSHDPSRWGDVNDDGVVDDIDIDLVFEAIGRPEVNPSRDIDLDGAVTPQDIDVLIREILGTVPGDVNLDGLVNESDFEVWSENRFSSNATWSAADVNGDGVADGSDFNILASTSRPLTSSAVDEPIEARVGDGPIEFEVRYSQRVELESIDDQDVWAIRLDNQAAIALSLVNAIEDLESTVATYRLSPPNGEWTWDDVANYELILLNEAVQDSGRIGNRRTTLAELRIQPEFESPTAMLSNSTLVANDEEGLIEIKYTDNSMIDVDSLDSQDIVLQNAEYTYEVIFVDFAFDADGIVTATYQLAEPFDLSQIGDYDVQVISGQVLDAGGNSILGAIVGMVSVVQDVNAPIATVDTTQTAYVADVWGAVVVVYEDDFGIDFDTVETSSLEVVRDSNGEVLRGEFLRAVANEEGTRVEASYFVNAGYTEFETPELASVRTIGVSDIGDTSPMSSELGTILLKPEVPFVDYAVDFGFWWPNEPVFESHQTASVTLTFSESPQGELANEDGPDIVIRHQESGRLLGAVRDSKPNDQALRFRVRPPLTGAEWDSGWATGSYQIRLLEGRLRVGDELRPEAIIGSFTIPNEQQDVEDPVAELVTTHPISPLTSLRVRYTDNRIVSGASVGDGDLRAVHTTTGKVMDAELFAAGAIDGPFVEYQYRLVKSDGPWEPDDFGEYEIHLNPSEIFDEYGNSAEPRLLGTVVVEADTVTIVATLLDVPVAYVGEVAPVEFALDFSPGLIAESTLDSSDIRVSNAPGEQLQVDFAGFTVSNVPGIINRANYRVFPLGEGWQESNLGDYTIELVENEVLDVSGKAVPAEGLGTLSVRYDTTIPFAVIPSVMSNGPGQTVTVSVYYQDRPTGIRLSTLDERDIQVMHIESGDLLPVSFFGGFRDVREPRSATGIYRFTPLVIGRYEIRLAPNEVEDLGGLTVESKRLAIVSVVEDTAFAESPRRSLRSLVGRRAT